MAASVALLQDKLRRAAQAGDESGNGQALGTLTSTPPATDSATATADPDASDNGSNGSVSSSTVVTLVVILTAILAFFFAFYLIRQARKKHKNPKYIPTKFLKRRWEKWDIQSGRYRLPSSQDHVDASRHSAARAPSSFPLNTDPATVDRHASVRSVMTLPAYNMTPSQNEQVLGREGERGGIDVVLEFPENDDEEEQHREAEMEALYQVRLARRRENEAREERRRLKREARARGDYAALRELQAQQAAEMAANAGRTVEELRAEHARLKKEGQRAVSSVAYGDLGVARHDGTRLRASSFESERQGLLGEAAGMATTLSHTRNRSTSSVLSMSTAGSDLPSPRLTRSRTDSRAESPGLVITTHDDASSQRAGSSPEIIGSEEFNMHSPPGYENISLDSPRDEERPPPDYSSPVDAPQQLDSGRSRRSIIGSLLGSRRTSGPANEQSMSSGVSRGPSLRLEPLGVPRINVDPGTPVIGNDEEGEGGRRSLHHPEE